MQHLLASENPDEIFQQADNPEEILQQADNPEEIIQGMVAITFKSFIVYFVIILWYV